MASCAMLGEFPYNNFILPRKDDKGILVTPLQYLSAVALTTSGDVFTKYCDEIPPNIFPLLLQATIYQSYSKLLSGEVNWFAADSIQSLIQFWPYQELNLRDHLLEIHFPARSSYKFTSLDNSKSKFSKFIQKLVEQMIVSLIFKRETCKARRFRIQRLDVSLVGAFVEEILYRYYLEVSKNEILKRRLELKPCELVCDIFLNDINFLKLFSLLSKTSQTSSSLTVTFGTISAESLLCQRTCQILNFAKNSVTMKYLNFNMCGLRAPATDRIFDVFPKSLEGLCLSYSFREGILNHEFIFLRQLPNLHQLDLSGIHSRDGWRILSELPRNLTHLKMAGCDLTPEDLESLARHSKSLRQIDLSHNPMHQEAKFLALAKLICSLEMIEVLELQDCQLGYAPPCMMASFLQLFLKSCPNVEILQLRGNDFSLMFMTNSLVKLTKKQSLRYLSLTVSSDVYLGDDYTNVLESIRSLKNVFDANIKALGNSKLQIEWNEDAKLSRWYYFV